MKRPLTWDSLNKLAIIFTLVAGIAAFLNFIGAQSAATLILVSICAILLGFLVIRLYLAQRLGARKQEMLEKLIHFSHHVSATLGHAKKAERFLMNVFITSQTLSDAMKYLTHTLQTEFKVTCSASCRVVENRNGNLVAVTVARSHHSSFRRIRDVGLPLDKNTAFLKAAKNEKAIILNDIGQNEDQTYSSARDLDRYYRSTLFYPILGGNDYLLGFLSLDSPKRSAFTEPMLEIIQFYADWCRLLLLELSAGTNTEKMKPDNHMDPDVE